uniref:Uncharacterized protein n=1 Tax=Oryza glumipatula TaxID=40148 RepID=A0A0E0ART4_9ORYZ
MLIQYSDVIRGMNGTIQENQKLCCIEQYPAPGTARERERAQDGVGVDHQRDLISRSCDDA